MSKNKVRLHAPPGTDEANWSGSPVPYRVDNHGDVLVDEEAVAPLLEKGGFTLADLAPVVMPNGHVQVLNPEDPAASCSFGGASYTPDADGVLTVPVEAVSALVHHGFVSVEYFTAALAASDAPESEPDAEPVVAPTAQKPAPEAKPAVDAKATAEPKKAAAAEGPKA